MSVSRSLGACTSSIMLWPHTRPISSSSCSCSTQSDTFLSCLPSSSNVKRCCGTATGEVSASGPIRSGLWLARQRIPPPCSGCCSRLGAPRLRIPSFALLAGSRAQRAAGASNHSQQILTYSRWTWSWAWTGVMTGTLTRPSLGTHYHNKHQSDARISGAVDQSWNLVMEW